MEAEKYLDDLKDIKEIMHRSSRFISLSGMAGVACGVIALLGAYFYYDQVYAASRVSGIYGTENFEFRALFIALATLFLALASAIFFTTRISRKKGLSLWDARSKQMLIRFLVPLGTGGLLSLIVFYHGFSILALPITLIFFGLGAYSASRFSYPELRSLGIVNVFLGLLASLFVEYALVFWALGFGVMNIIYGIAVYFKYESNNK